MEEIWRDIPGFEGYYQASTHGRIRSVERTVEYVKHYGGKRCGCKTSFPFKDSRAWANCRIQKSCAIY